MPKATPLEERFWSKVAKSDDPNACWEWTASRYSKGYGFFRRRSSRKLGNKGSTAQAHRMAWELTNGPIPAGRHILHTCDNPPCCNPAHLYLGDNAKNMEDRISRHRQAKKMTREKAEEVRRLYAAGEMNQTQIAQAFGIGTMTVSQIVRGDIWKSAGGETKRVRAYSDRRQKKKLDWDQAREIRRLCLEGVRRAEIAVQFGVSRGTVLMIHQNRTWKE